MIKNSRMHTIVKQVSRFNNYKPRSIAQQKYIRVYNTGNETPVSAITRNVTDGTGYIPSTRATIWDYDWCRLYRAL